MLIKLILLFTIVPIVELAILIEIGRQIGLLPTLLIVILTGVIGASLARSQGLRVFVGLRENISQGIFPAEQLFDGTLILAGGLLLLTPGILTDLIGFLTLIPLTRRIIKRALKRKVESMIRSGRVHINLRFR